MASVMDKLDTSIAGLAGASTNENFLKTAFSPSLKVSNISEPLVIGRNIIVLQLIGEGKNKTDSIPAEAIQDEFKNLDLNSANNTLHESSKFIDNFNAVYSTYMQTK